MGVKVTAENPLTGERFHTARAYVTMVALDSHGRSRAVARTIGIGSTTIVKRQHVWLKPDGTVMQKRR